MTADTRHLRPHPTHRMTDPTFAAVVAAVLGPPGLVRYPPRSPALLPPPVPRRGRAGGLAPRLALGGSGLLLLLALLRPGSPPARAVVSFVIPTSTTTPGAGAPPAAAPPHPAALARVAATLVAPTAPQSPAPVLTVPSLAAPLLTVLPTLPPPTLVPPTVPRWIPPPTLVPPTPPSWTPPSVPPTAPGASRLPPPRPTDAPVVSSSGSPTPGTGAAGNDWSDTLFQRSATIHAEPTP